MNSTAKAAEAIDNNPLREKNRQIAQLKKKLNQQSNSSSLQIKQLQDEIQHLNAALKNHQDKVHSDRTSLLPTISWPALGQLNSNDILSASLSLITPFSTTQITRSQPQPGFATAGFGIEKASTALAEHQKTDYAAGILIGRNIVQMTKRNAALNISTDQQMVVRGIEDLLAKRSLLTEEDVNQELLAMGSTLQEATEAFSSRHQQAGAAYVEKFIRRAGTHRAPAGFYYKVEKKGHGSLAANDIVDIRVRESLIDGTVISDNVRSGAVISQRLLDYPPLFQDALNYAGKKGMITLVVPPELAYGDEGNPPLIPPGATMVYSIEVAEVK